MATMSAFTQKINRWLDPARTSMPPAHADPIGEQVRAAVAAQTKAKTDASRSYETRVQMMVDDLFLKMRKADPYV